MIKAIIFDVFGVLVAEQGAINEALLAYIRRELKPSYHLAILSNLAPGSIEHLLSPEDLRLFDRVSLSSQMEFGKADPRAYLQMAEWIGVAPDECIFIDDQQRHCEAADIAGLQAIHYESFDQLKRELSRLRADKL